MFKVEQNCCFCIFIIVSNNELIYSSYDIFHERKFAHLNL